MDLTFNALYRERLFTAMPVTGGKPGACTISAVERWAEELSTDELPDRLQIAGEMPSPAAESE